MIDYVNMLKLSEWNDTTYVVSNEKINFTCLTKLQLHNFSTS